MALKVQQNVVFSSPQIMKGEKLQALIEDISPEGITLNIPWGGLDVREGTELVVSFWDEHATYEFTSKTTVAKPPALSSMKISRPSALVKVINRSFSRLTVNLKAEAGPYEDMKKEPCVIIDLSAGGAFMHGQSIYKAGDLLKVTFELADGEKYENIVAKIVWKKETSGMANYGLQFENLSTIRRQKLSLYIEHALKNVVV